MQRNLNWSADPIGLQLKFLGPCRMADESRRRIGILRLLAWDTTCLALNERHCVSVQSDVWLQVRLGIQKAAKGKRNPVSTRSV